MRAVPWDDYAYRVASNRSVTPVIAELWAQPMEARLPYAPGQYVLLGDAEGLLPPRSYSVANAPRPDGAVSLLVTRVDRGPTSSWVHEGLSPGGLITLSGPYGSFLLEPHGDGPVLLLAAGSGLAPARALAQSLLADQPDRPVTLFFSARTAADTMDHQRFLDWQQDHETFTYLLTLTRDPTAPRRGRIPGLLAEVMGDLHDTEVFASGPPRFVSACAEVAVSLGADPAAVHTEEFFADPQPWTGTPPPATRPEVRGYE